MGERLVGIRVVQGIFIRWVGMVGRWKMEGAKRFGWFKAYSFHQDVVDAVFCCRTNGKLGMGVKVNRN